MNRIAAGLLALAIAFFATLASAQSPIRGFPPGTFQSRAPIDASGGGASFSLVYSSTGNSSASTTTISYGTLAYASGATRIVVGVSGYLNGAVSSVSVGGNALAPIAGAAVTVGGVYSDVWQSTAPLSGSSGAVSVTYASAPNYVTSVALYSLTTTTPASSAQQSTFHTSSAAALAVSINIPTGGGALAITNNAGPGSGNTVTFTNATIDINGNSPATDSQYYAHTTATGAATSVSALWSAINTGSLTVVAWGP